MILQDVVTVNPKTGKSPLGFVCMLYSVICVRHFRQFPLESNTDFQKAHFKLKRKFRCYSVRRVVFANILTYILF